MPAVKAHSDAAVLPNLDGIRAVACLLVVLVHMPVPDAMETLGATGVGIFFVLSGFLMSYLYARESWDFQSVCRYGIARFSRIAPIYWLVISACILISYFGKASDFSERIVGPYQVARHFMFSGSAGVFWSIAPEVQYYAFFLLIWLAIARRTTLAYALPLICLLCAALVLTHNLWPGLALPNKLHFFLAGSIAGLVPRRIGHGALDESALFFLQSGALILIIAPIWFYASKEDFYSVTELGIALAVAVYLLSIPSRWTTFILASPLLRRIGHASFSIYLMHQLVLHYGMRILGLSREHYEPLWLVLGLAGVALPMLASHFIEIPLSSKTRHLLEKIFGLGLSARRQPQSA